MVIEITQTVCKFELTMHISAQNKNKILVSDYENMQMKVAYQGDGTYGSVDSIKNVWGINNLHISNFPIWVKYVTSCVYLG